jgi:hypothetical protein
MSSKEKTFERLWLSFSIGVRRIYSFAGVRPLKCLNNKKGDALLK